MKNYLIILTDRILITFENIVSVYAWSGISALNPEEIFSLKFVSLHQQTETLGKHHMSSWHANQIYHKLGCTPEQETMPI